MPPLTHDSAPELVPGAPIPQQTRRVRVVRPFMFGGEALQADSEVDLPKGFAAEVLAAGKAAPVAAAETATSAQADAERSGRPDKAPPAKPGRATAA